MSAHYNSVYCKQLILCRIGIGTAGKGWEWEGTEMLVNSRTSLMSTIGLVGK